jgi:putative inorganic carbon (HCO3(-)) transporter
MKLGLHLNQNLPIFIYLAAIVCLLFTLLYRAELGLYLLILLIPLQNVLDKLHQFPLGNNLVDIFLMAIFLGYYFQRPQSQGNDQGRYLIGHDKNLNIAIFLLIVITYVSLWVGSLKLDLPLPIYFDNPRLADWKNFARIPLLYYAAVNLIKDRRQVMIVIYLMIITMIYMDRVYYNEVGGWNIGHFREDKRFKGAVPHLGPNELAAFYSYYTMFLLGFLLYEKNKIRMMIFSGIIAFNAYCILFLFSRGAYLATLAGIVFLGIANSRKLLIIPIALFVAWHTLLPVSVIERIEMTQTEEGTDTSILGRIQMWERALEIISSNPIAGVGFGDTVYLNFKNYSGEKDRSDIHNGYLEVLMETGVVGLSMFFIIFIIAIKKGWMLFRQSDDPMMKGLGLGFVAMIVASLVANTGGDRWSYLEVMGYFWILLGVVSSVLLIQTEKKEHIPHLKVA